MMSSTRSGASGGWVYPRPVRVWFQRPAWDLPIAAVLAVGLWYGSTRAGPYWLQSLDIETRRAVYQTLTTLSGTLLGLVLTSISVLNTVLRQPLDAFAESALHPDRKQAVARLFFAAVRALALGVAVNLVVLIWDTKADVGGRWAQAIAIGVLALVICRVARMLWALALVVAVSTRGSSPAKRPPPAISDDEY